MYSRVICKAIRGAHPLAVACLSLIALGCAAPEGDSVDVEEAVKQSHTLKSLEGSSPIQVFKRLLVALLFCSVAVDAAATVLHASVRQEGYAARIGQPIRVIAEMTAERDLKGCEVKLASPAPFGLGYQFTKGQGGPRIGPVNTPRDLKALEPQALVLIIAPRTLLDDAEFELAFVCADGTRAENLPKTNTLLLTVNAPLLDDETAALAALLRREYARDSRSQECQAWPVEHVFDHFDHTLLVRVTGARMDEATLLPFPRLGRVILDYEVQEVLRGRESAIQGIAGPLIPADNQTYTVMPLGKRFIISSDGGEVRWERCSKYWIVPVDEANDCQLYRYRRLASDATPYDDRCEASSIVSYLDRLNVASGTPNDGSRLDALKKIWFNATGLVWNGEPVPNSILYRTPHKERTEFLYKPSGANNGR